MNVTAKLSIRVYYCNDALRRHLFEYTTSPFCVVFRLVEL